MNEMNEIKEVLFLVKKSEEGGMKLKLLVIPFYTQPEDLESLRKAVKDAINCHFEKEKRLRIVILHIVKYEILTL